MLNKQFTIRHIIAWTVFLSLILAVFRRAFVYLFNECCNLPNTAWSDFYSHLKIPLYPILWLAGYEPVILQTSSPPNLYGFLGVACGLAITVTVLILFLVCLQKVNEKLFNWANYKTPEPEKTNNDKPEPPKIVYLRS